MEKLIIEGTPKTPYVNFDGETGLFEIRGRSIPENAIAFYKPLIEYIDNYLKEPQEISKLKINFEWFNKSTRRSLLDLFKWFEKLTLAGKQVYIRWDYEEDDEDMLEEIEDYASIIKIPFLTYELEDDSIIPIKNFITWSKDSKSRFISSYRGWGQLVRHDNISAIEDIHALNADIKDFSKCVDKLENVELLNMTNNSILQLEDIVYKLKDVKKLKSLCLRNNDISDISEITHFVNLTALDIGSNKISDITPLEKLKDLTYLNIGDNHIADLSPLSKLVNLKVLIARYNVVEDISPLDKLDKLEDLHLRGNRIKDITVLNKLNKLTRLDIGDNEISDIDAITTLNDLSALNISSNIIGDITSISTLKELETCYWFGNKIHSPPPDILKQGLNAVKNYLRQLELSGANYLHEAKAIFVGEPGSGKTTLMNKLLDHDFPVPNEMQESTIGVSICAGKGGYQFPFKNTNFKFTANLWDFGGQQIQYCIHQFFLTPRSLYILLADEREEKTRFDYWFNIIELLGNNSPVLVVLNQRNFKSATSFDMQVFQNRYPNLAIDKREVDLSKTDKRFLDLDDQVKTLLSNLNHIGDRLPVSWIDVRKELEKRKSENFISFDTYDKICNQFGIKKEQDQLVMSTYLNDIGVILHFQNDENLANTIFLNPEWIAKGLYVIFSNGNFKKANGIFSKEEIYDAWGNDYTYEEKNLLLTLMQKNNFDICFKLNESADSHKYLTPLLLSELSTGLALNWDKKDNLSFRVQYKFMPEGILSRFIVRISDFIYKCNGEGQLWKKGVVLKKGGNLALVKEDISNEGLKVIDIFINGEVETRKEFLRYIRYELDYIHKSFQNIPIELMIPCCCSDCKANSRIYFYKVSSIERYITNKKSFITCDYSTEDVSIKELVEGVAGETTLRESYTEANLPDLSKGDNLQFAFKDDIINKLFETIKHVSKKDDTINININLSIKNDIKVISDTLSYMKEDILDEVEDDKEKKLISKDIDKVGRALKEIESFGEHQKEEAKSSGAMTKLANFINKFNDTSTRIGKAVKHIEDGVGYAQDIAKRYNSIAQWCGLPVVPDVFLKKGKTTA